MRFENQSINWVYNLQRILSYEPLARLPTNRKKDGGFKHTRVPLVSFARCRYLIFYYRKQKKYSINPERCLNTDILTIYR